MFKDRQDIVERIVTHLRRPVRIDPTLDERVMQEIAQPQRGRASGAALALWRWLTRPRVVAVSPLGGLALAAGVAALALALAGRRPESAPPAEAAPREFQFVVVAPRAGQVSLVGDFNDWDAGRTPMRRPQGTASVWTALVPLAPGRYRYAFLVDGSHWLADPTAPSARDDEFGRPSSVVTVGGL